MTVDSRLDTVVSLPDGTSMVTYVGSWNGMPATISRGDGQLLIDIDTVSQFDAMIAEGLPARSHLQELGDVTVLNTLGGDIVFADGTHGQMYNATQNGASVVATRSENHLDMTSLSSTGMDIEHVTVGQPDVEHEHLPAGIAGGEPPLVAASSTEARSRGRRSADNDRSPNRLTFHLMLHDDVGISSQRFHAGYIAWWLADLQRNITPGKKVDVLYSQGIPGVTDVRYQYIGSLHDWSDVIETYALEQHIPRTYKHKFMLVVKGIPEPGRYGRSWQKGSEGIASISGRYPEVAHQLGHMLGATHARAEVRYGGWWCETNMYTPSLLLRSNCYGYSTANMRLMDDYIRTGQGFLALSRWSEDR